jgi:DNA-binding transcriptional ArsR family regulator
MFYQSLLPRLRILRGETFSRTYLMSGEASVAELAEPFALSLPTISRHLRVLERAGLIVRGRAAQWRPCRLQPAPLKEVAEWVEDYRMAWEHKLDRLHDYLSESRAKKRNHGAGN